MSGISNPESELVGLLSPSKYNNNNNNNKKKNENFYDISDDDDFSYDEQDYVASNSGSTDQDDRVKLRHKDRNFSYPGSEYKSKETPLLATKQILRSNSLNLPNYIKDDIDEDTFANQIFSSVDKFEDEFDKQAYEELIPLNIRMELENRLFGWNHLYSQFLGHILFPLFYYLTTFWALSLFALKFVPAQTEEDNCSIRIFDRCISNRYSYCIIHKISFHDTVSNGDISNIECEYKPILGLSINVFLFLRQFFSLLAAFNAFRTVRRRRKVWLRATAAEYFKSKKAQDEMDDVDRNTLLGKIRTKMLNRRIQKKLRKADKRYIKRDKLRRKKYIAGSTSYEREHHVRVKHLANDKEITDDIDTEDKYIEVYQKYGSNTTDFLDNEEEVYHSHFYAHTIPTFAMQSINLDQIHLKSLFKNVAYAHGGFFGAAPFMLANPHWIDILRQLMPDVYVEISRRAVKAPVPQLIHWAENNPVVAAYGVAHEMEFSGKVPTLEWDVFLDPHLVKRVEVVLNARDSFLKELSKTSKRINKLLNREEDKFRFTDKMKAVATILDSGVGRPKERSMSNEERVFVFYNAEIEKRVDVLLENMLIAHGSFSQLFLEQTGSFKQYNFSRVKHTRRTLGGGIFAKHWISTFVEALKMSTKSDGRHSTSQTDYMSDDSDSSACSSTNLSPLKTFDEVDEFDANTPPLNGSKSDEYELRDSSKNSDAVKRSTSFHDLALSAINPSSISESISELKRVTQCDAPLGLIFDLKSRYIPKRIWALVLDALRKAGARVEGIATFFEEDLRGISRFCSVPVKEIIFHHSAGDVQHACHKGTIKQGDSVFFNAGSLFWNHPVESLSAFAQMICTSLGQYDIEKSKKQYKFQSYARVKHSKSRNSKDYLAMKEDSTSSISSADIPNGSSETKDKEIRFQEGNGSTIQQYKEHFGLSLGLYVQEFCVDDKIMELLVEYVNKNEHIYDLGFSWGGVNGMTVKGIQPGRVTSTDGKFS